jgi:ATP-dependent protease Clp ATPase subunit
MEQTPPFPSPEELKSKLAEFMKSNFGDRVAFTTLTQPDTVETGTDEKSPPEEAKDFDFHFLPRDIKAHLDRFVIKQDEAKKVLSIAVCDHYNHVNHVRQLEKERADGAVRDGICQAKCHSRRPDWSRKNVSDQTHRLI